MLTHANIDIPNTRSITEEESVHPQPQPPAVLCADNSTVSFVKCGNKEKVP